MYYNNIYSQLFNFIPRYRFEKIVKKSGGDRYCKLFTVWKQFLTLLFAQISGKESLREIENTLFANRKRLYHPGMEAVTKSTLSEAMIHSLLFAYIKFLHGFKSGMTERTNHIGNTLMQNQFLPEVLSPDRKILEKPPNGNLPVQKELISPLLL